ncbi:MAG TPA: alpha-glucan family phosphorylase [Bacteroidales bacterium]|nr:alpha-glucan family phosphorylase [Bacteroidales bacterium]
MFERFEKPDYLFEVSWEICNKIGGIHTVISTKAAYLSEILQDKYITIGPDVWKETHTNPEFIEDKYLYRAWRKQAYKTGLHFRVGRWNIPGRPVTVLVDFTPLFAEKNVIFTDFWQKYGLNSLSGQWDYTEPALFGYAAGQIIESFYNFHLTEYDRIIAHFHEWMTGSGVLFLRDRVPQVGTLFTTHATVLARSMGSHGYSLYRDITSINPESKANDLGIASKHSMEATAAVNADVLTTVSELTSNECEIILGRKVDVVTPNGFDLTLVPKAHDFAAKRKIARKRLMAVTEGLLNQKIPENAYFVATSGRYEFKNKGLDIFIDALARINQSKAPNTTVVAFIMVPAHQTGAKPEVLSRIENPDFDNPVTNEYSTHILTDPEKDQIVLHLKKSGLTNAPGDKVKVVFMPAYLNGNDGVVNLDYYDTLIGFDLSAFPSYYEPWGYTPLESLAFGVPAITTSLAGFGIWAREKALLKNNALMVIDRNDDNDSEATETLIANLVSLVGSTNFQLVSAKDDASLVDVHENLLKARVTAFEIAREALWTNLIEKYFTAYELALDKTNLRFDQYKGKRQPVKIEKPAIALSKPVWKKILVEVKIPTELEHLQKLAKNLWWTWNYQAEDLFASIEPELWVKCEKNPNLFLEQLSIEDYNSMLANKRFMKQYHEVVQSFESYMEAANHKKKSTIAYFSMEYGLHTSVKIYSGGLGILAGDYLKEASDDNIDLVAIGLLYRYGYFSQTLSVAGEQQANYHPHNFSHMSAVPVRNQNGDWIKISIAFPGRILHAKVWKIDVGRIPLYLLDTDIPENITADRYITHQLYGGDWENRFKQEFLLGIGGIRMLEAIGISPKVYHLNEGHAAFAGLERLRKLVQDHKLNFFEALEAVRASSLFTTHTPVPAGHDHFSEDYLRTYMPHYASRLGISWETFMGLGKINPVDHNETYSMSVLATKLSQEVNGVSRLHGKVSREMFKELYPGFFPDELHIGYVTNGVHYGTWTAKEWQQLYSETFGADFHENIADEKHWQKIYHVPDERIWEIRNHQRQGLMEFIRGRMLANLSKRQENPKKIYQILEGIDDKVLTIGFARRFATYKRAHLLFNDLDRLSRIVNNPSMPVQFIYAGKAHPADKGGQELIKFIVEVSRRPDFKGKIIFLEDYDMELGASLTRGVDVWLNTPTRPMEASGTSGMKAVLNGVLNFSVLDGWWCEGYVPEGGWAIKEEKTYDNDLLQDELDAETIYSTLENEIIPLFYERDKHGVPVEWVRWLKNNIAQIAPHFTNKRMLDDYFERYYNRLFESSDQSQEDNFSGAIEKTRWKSNCLRKWATIEVETVKTNNGFENSLCLGDSFQAEVILDIGGFNPDEIGVEVVFVKQSIEEENETISIYELEQVPGKRDGALVTYRCNVKTRNAGVYNYSFRAFPKGKMLANRQDLPLLKWI